MVSKILVVDTRDFAEKILANLDEPMTEKLKWRDMSSIPKPENEDDYFWIVVKPKKSEPEIAGPCSGGRWQTNEGAIYKEDQLEGWLPLPRD